MNASWKVLLLGAAAVSVYGLLKKKDMKVQPVTRRPSAPPAPPPREIPEMRRYDRVDEASRESFPASDPPGWF